jgi:ribosome-associated translation inhibitor RaiA
MLLAQGSINRDRAQGVCLMIKLDSGNVLLKPSHRRQLMTWLRRAMRLGNRIGNFALTISMQRIGRAYEVRATVEDSAGTLTCRSKRHDWQDALRDLVRRLTQWLHEQQLRHATAAV